jgi:hypothetical protein
MAKAWREIAASRNEGKIFVDGVEAVDNRLNSMA